MTFERYWNSLASDPADSAELLFHCEFAARHAWEAATLAEREGCVSAIKAISDSHCAATGECGHGCDFVTAWETATDELQKRAAV